MYVNEWFYKLSNICHIKRNPDIGQTIRTFILQKFVTTAGENNCGVFWLSFMVPYWQFVMLDLQTVLLTANNCYIGIWVIGLVNCMIWQSLPALIDITAFTYSYLHTVKVMQFVARVIMYQILEKFKIFLS